MSCGRIHRQVVRRGRQVHADVDASQLVNTVEAVDPHRGCLVELVKVIRLDFLVRVRLILANAVRVVSFVVQYQNILAGSDGRPQHPVDQGRIAQAIP